MRSFQQLSGRTLGNGFQPPTSRRPQDRSGRLSELPRFRSVESAKLIEHQMYFWGRDVLSPNGNLLMAAGCQSFRREECSHAVRCYRLETSVAAITLHSTGISLQMADGSPGVVYLRPTHQLYHVPEGALPLPYGRDVQRSLRRVLPKEFPQALTTLLSFVRAYEQWAGDEWLPEGSRLAAWKEQRSSATKGVRWLKPQDSLRWLDACLASRQTAAPNQYTAPETFHFPMQAAPVD